MKTIEHLFKGRTVEQASRIESSVEVRAPKRSRYIVRKFECQKHGEFEELVLESERLNPQKCPTCGKKSESTFIMTRAALPPASLVYEKVVGGKTERCYVDPQVPESCVAAEKMGFQRREIQGVAQARAFEREVAAEMRREFAQQQGLMNEKKSAALREAHDEIRRLMPSMDSFSRAVAEEAIRDSQSGYSREYDPQFRMPVYSE